MQTVQARFSRDCVLGIRVVGLCRAFCLFCFKIRSNLSDKGSPSGNCSMMGSVVYKVFPRIFDEDNCEFTCLGLNL